MPKHSTPGRDLYAEVTAKLIAAIEGGAGEPAMPWRRTNGQPLWRPTNAVTGQPYRGINVVMLWGAAESAVTADGRPLDCNQWATYKQWQQIGAQVRKGEQSSVIVKYGEFTARNATPTPAAPAAPGVAVDTDAEDGRRLYLKAYHVFNARQVDGYVIPEAPASLGPLARVQAVETFVANTKAVVIEGGERAYYSPSRDEIHLPDEGLFTGTAHMTREESHAAVKLHETVHWTSHPSRLDRQLGKRFGDDQYAAEELIGEIGSALLCAELGVSQDVRADHAQYLSHWLSIMKASSRAIFTAAAAAERAVQFLKNLQPEPPQPQAAPTRTIATDAQITKRATPRKPARAP
jgi:antirestriction protein ArdC